MSGVSVDPNTSLQRVVPKSLSAERSKGSGSCTDILRAFVRPVVSTFRYTRFRLMPADNPQAALQRIDTIAERGLQRAAVRGVKVEPEAAQKLFTIEASPSSESEEAGLVGPVADISPMEPDPRVTRAPHLQAQVEDPHYWRRELVRNQTRLEEKIAANTALLQMCKLSNLELKDKDYLALMNIVKRFTEGNEGKSLWSFFSEFVSKREISFFQKLKAATFYFFYYYTSILTNTIKAYLKPAIKNLTEDLTKESSDIRSFVFRKVIKNLNGFLEEDIRATKNYAFEKEPGDLDDIRDRAIERFYNFSLPDLCRSFSDKRVNDDNPTVELFGPIKKIPLIGYIFKGLEYFINRFIIRKNMKSWILPTALQNVVKNGLAATEPQNIPFSLNLTRFINLQLEKLKVQLDASSPQTETTAPFPGTELLAPTIRNLLEVLELEPITRARELRWKFQSLEKGKWIHDEKIEKSIEAGIINAGNILFKYLNETSKSGELFARLLDLSCAPFSGEQTSEEVLKAQFETEKQKLEDLCSQVGKQIVTDAVSKVVNGPHPEDANKMAKQTFTAGKNTADRALAELDRLCQQMSKKIDLSAHSPTEENNTQNDIAYFLQIMKVLANQKEIRKLTNSPELSQMDLDAIWRIMTPLYEKAVQIEERMLTLQELQNQYPSHAIVKSQLQIILDLYRSIEDQFQAQSPKHLQNHLIQTLGVASEEISKCLGAKSGAAKTTKENIEDVAKLTEKVVERQKVIDTIYALYPPRNEQDPSAEGLLDQLLNYERGVHPTGFKPRLCLEEMAKILKNFPDEDRKKLESLIGNGSNLKAKWQQLGIMLQQIYQKHMDLRKVEQRELNKALTQATQFTQEMLEKYTLLKEKDHLRMQTEIGSITEGINSLKTQFFQAQLGLPPSLSSTGAKLASGTLCSLLGAGVGLVTAGPAGAVVGAGIGAGAGEHILARPDEKNHRPLAKTAGGILVGTVAGVASAAMWPFASLAGTAAATYSLLGAASGAVYAGWHAKRAFQSIVQEHVEKKVLDISKSAYKLGLHPRLYKMGATRAMSELAKA